MRPDIAPAPGALSPATTAFIQGGVSIRLASCGIDGKPVTARAVAATVDAQRRRVTLLVDTTVATPFLEAVRGGGMVAAAFTQPTTHRSLQIKGGAAEVHPPAADALDIIDRHGRAFAVELREIAFSDAFIAAHEAFSPDALVAVTFSAADAFDQTPGPRAGDALAP